jgi:thymidylate synthase
MITRTIDMPFRRVYRQLLDQIIDEGSKEAPRGLETREVMGAILRFMPDAWGRFDTLVTECNRGISVKVAAVESLQLIGGFCNPVAMVNASKHFSLFAEGGGFWGGYGVRTRAQMPAVLQRLIDDPSTRRAQITFWDPSYDLVEGARDYPCTTAMRFFVRHNRLCAHTTMRSNDAYRGLPYDVFVFTQLQQAVAGFLGLRCGEYQHHVSSLHVYESDFDKVHEVHMSLAENTDPRLFTDDNHGWKWTDITRFLRDSVSIGMSYGAGPWADPHGVEWYARQWAQVAS